MGSAVAKEKAEDASIEYFASSELTINDWNFRRAEEQEFTSYDAERLSRWKLRFKNTNFHTSPIRDTPMIKFRTDFQFTLASEIGGLSCLITADQDIFDQVVVGEEFPRKIDADTFESGGLMEVENPLIPNALISRSFEFFVPISMTERKLFFFFFNDACITLGKGKCDFAIDAASGLARATTAKKERNRRLEGISLLNQLMGQDFQNILRASSAISRPKTQFVEGDDGTKLAYRSYQMHSFCQAVLVLTSTTSVILDPLALEVSKKYPVVVKIVEVRGYGDSAGKRGCSSRISAVWRDLKSFLLNFRFNHHELPIFLGGHYTSAGMILNYSTWSQREPADGYVFLAPDFGTEFIKPERLNKFYSDLKTKYHWGTVLLGKISNGYFSGSDPAYEFEYPDVFYKFVPNLVDSISTNNVRACSPTNCRVQLQSLQQPYGVWVAEEDEFLYSQKIFDLVKEVATGECMFDLLSATTHFGIVLKVADQLGKWMLDISNSKIQLSSDKSEELDVVSQSTERLRKRVERSMLDLSHELFTAIIDLKLNLKPQYYVVSNDGAPLGFSVYTPQHQKPGACLIFLGGIEKAVPCHILCEKYNILVINMIGRPVEHQSKVVSKETYWSDIRSMVRHAKFHNPNLFHLLGGHGIGASMVLNYATWKHKEPVGAYVMISPAFDPRYVSEADRRFITSEAEKHVDAALSESPSWLQKGFQLNLDSMDFETPQYSRAYWNACFPSDFTEQVRSVDSPLGLWVGSKDEVVNGSRLVDSLSSIHHPPLSRVELVQGATHFGALMTAAFHVGPWIERFVAMLVPTPVRLREPRIEDFNQIQILGRGAYGKVYLVQHIATGKYFAMKTLRKAEICSLGEREIHYVINERNVLRDIDSKWVVSFIGSFQTEQLLCILMEYVIGGELFTYLRLEGRFQEEQAKFYAAEIVLFFEYLHEKEIVYRDLKPENILLDSMGHVKVTDMGFAKRLKNGQKTSSFCGTIDYLSPEVLQKQEYGVSCDYWALGILIYEMLSGYPPFTASNKNTIIRRILFAEVEFEDHVHPHAQDLILRLLRKNPKKRLGSGQAGIEDIKNHRWFRGTSWELLANREISAPFSPRFSHEGDASNYLVVEEEDKTQEKRKSFGDFFKDF